MTERQSNGRIDSYGTWWIHESDIVWRRILEDDDECWTNATDAKWLVRYGVTPVSAIGIEGFSETRISTGEKLRTVDGEWIRIPPLSIRVFATVGERPTHVEEAPHD